jgi:hypothetical protein
MSALLGFYLKYKSTITGKDCVMICNRTTNNTKTGPGWQTWHFLEDVSPLDSVKTGEDESLCGQCPRRHFLGGDCYVLVFRSPQRIWQAYKSGKYKSYDELTRRDISYT